MEGSYTLLIVSLGDVYVKQIYLHTGPEHAVLSDLIPSCALKIEHW